MKHRNLFFAFIIAIFLITTSCATVSKTPLIEASTKGDSLAAKKLISGGANINEPDSKGDTPLIHAIRSGNIETAKYLIEVGADIKVKDKQGSDALICAAEYGQIEIVTILLNRGANIESKDNTSSTPLAYAVASGHYDIIEYLLNRGANIESKDHANSTPLAYAVASGHFEIIELLLNRGANIDSKDWEGATPIANAIRGSANNRIIQLLIKRGANLNLRGTEGYTPLNWALFYKKMDIVAEIKKAMAIARQDKPSAKIIFIRESNALIPGEMQDVEIYIDEEMVVSLSGDSMDYIDVNPGKCTMVIKGGKLESNHVKSVDAVAGQTYYFLVTIRTGKAVGKAAGELVGGLIGGLVVSQIADEGTVLGGLFKITPLEESVAKEKIKTLKKVDKL